MVRFTANEFINKYQHEDVMSVLSPSITDSFIKDVCDQVNDYIRPRATKFVNPDELSDWKKEQLRKAQMERALEVLTNGRESEFGPKVIGILTRAGFLYRGL